jgi:hypothetical protein
LQQLFGRSERASINWRHSESIEKK